ncbi:hypothetical protein [Hyphomicrobium sp. ghe19]|uniref:hypothetical protein n=1 Tax=Hyphomicrobium sp. ghe19 TaxID=2682968 RepID=UPI001366E581|nr:hypothetical protein HYPP_03830 [Hyphomicrobium sp. ghe19]
MTNPNFARDEFVEGAGVARSGKPFSPHTSRPWQSGFTFQKRRQVLKAIGPAKYHFVELLLVSLGLVCQMLASQGAEVRDLAEACAHRAFEGTDIEQDTDPRVDPPAQAFELVQ